MLDTAFAPTKDFPHLSKKANLKIMPNRKGEMIDTYANIDKARSAINYNPTTTIEQTVQIYYDWFISQDEWYKKGHF